MSIKSQLRGLSTKSIGGYEGGPYFLSQMGIKTEKRWILDSKSIRFGRIFRF